MSLQQIEYALQWFGISREGIAEVQYGPRDNQ